MLSETTVVSRYSKCVGVLPSTKTGLHRSVSMKSSFYPLKRQQKSHAIASLIDNNPTGFFSHCLDFRF